MQVASSIPSYARDTSAIARSAWLFVSLLALTAACQSAPIATPAPPTPIGIPYAPVAANELVAIPTPVQAIPATAERGALPAATIQIGDLDRTYLYYVPTDLLPNAPLLIVLHGAGMDGEQMRPTTGYEFEQFADKNGFVVAYPTGYQRTWNDCRRRVQLASNLEHIDDVAFIRALIKRFSAEYRIDTARVYAMGFSNGAHMAYRLAVELPDEIAAVAAVGANFSAEDDSDCYPLDKPIPAMIINGTADPLNPYSGGAANFGATVRSTQATAEYFARRNGQSDRPQIAPVSSSASPVERETWNDSGKPEVVLITIKGGGHVVPRFSYLDGPAEIWDFFSRQTSLR